MTDAPGLSPLVSHLIFFPIWACPFAVILWKTWTRRRNEAATDRLRTRTVEARRVEDANRPVCRGMQSVRERHGCPAIPGDDGLCYVHRKLMEQKFGGAA